MKPSDRIMEKAKDICVCRGPGLHAPCGDAHILEAILEYLDEQQERHSRSPGCSHDIVFGAVNNKSND